MALLTSKKLKSQPENWGRCLLAIGHQGDKRSFPYLIPSTMQLILESVQQSEVKMHGGWC